jgi:hypothetical protein
MAEHTPGEWRIGRGSEAGLVRAFPADGGPGVAICEMRYDFQDLRQVHANGDLISAAPDLLGACEAALEWGMPAVLAGEMRAAVNKARGRA